jgi:hypothetical protein
MPTIENRTNQLLIVAKNSGPSVFLGPGEGALVPAFEIDGNAKIEKLVRAGALSIKQEVKEEIDPAPGEPQEGAKGPGPKARSKNISDPAIA